MVERTEFSDDDSHRQSETDEVVNDIGTAAVTGITEFYRPAQETTTVAPLIFDFPTSADARAYIKNKVDVPAREHKVTIDGRVRLHVYTEQLNDERFTNVYDLSYEPDTVAAKIRINNKPRSISSLLAEFPECIAAASSAFLYLADQGSGIPRQTALNLALKEAGVLCSVPVVDREALVADADGLSVCYLRAFGELTINDRPLTWSGSRTDHETDCQMFGNGNVVIQHLNNDAQGARKERIRVLDESSRFTTSLDEDSGLMDAGLIAGKNGRFRVLDMNQTGKMDLFEYDAVIRCSREYMRQGTDSAIQFRSVDSLKISDHTQGAISVGPLLSETQFELNPINNDPSLGSDPPFFEVPMVRLVLYAAASGTIHLRLFDGRPESDHFKGVTPNEAASIIRAEEEIVWGCFLDPGRTAKLATKMDNHVTSYGNTHYLKWPETPNGRYTWVPGAGRPIPSIITLE